MKYLKFFEKYNNKFYNSELLAACESNNLKYVKILIENGADVNVENDEGHTPLIFAINKNYDINIIKELIKAGADINHQDTSSQGWTPLLLVAFYLSAGIYGDIDILKILIDNDADWNIRGRMVKITFFDYLNGEQKEEIIKEYPDKYKEYLLKLETEKYNI